MKNQLYKILLVLILLLGLPIKLGFCDCSQEFKEKIIGLKWVAYAPTNYDPTADRYPSEDSIREDLALLYKYGFRGVVTYGASGTLAKIPQIAREAGFSGVVMGIWDIESEDEITNALQARDYVDGYCVGNEGLNCRYDLDTLNQAISKIKETTGKPATTTEQIDDYANDNVLAVGDWIFPNIHPFLCEIKDPKKGAEWIQKHYQRLKKHAADRPVFFKEVGYPTAGALEATEVKQKEFFYAMEADGVPFVYFEAFDQFWKTDLPVESHWGLFDAHRNPKEYISSK